MQVEVDLKCMQTIFGGCGLSGFGDFFHFRLPPKWARGDMHVWALFLALCMGQSISNCHLTPNVTSAFPVNFFRSDYLSLEKHVLLYM